jgi:endoglucanase
MANREMPARDTVLKAVSGMANYLRQNPQPPERVDAEGVPQNVVGPVGFSAALLPYLDATGNKASLEQQKSRIQSQRNSITQLFGQQHTYYDQNLALFATGWMERRFRFGSGGELIVSWKKE